MSVIAIPNILREKLGEAVVQALIEVLNQIEDRTKERAIESVEQRFEKRLIEEISKLRVEVHNMRADVVKWMFLFWIGQVATITGLFAFFRK